MSALISSKAAYSVQLCEFPPQSAPVYRINEGCLPPQARRQRVSPINPLPSILGRPAAEVNKCMEGFLQCSWTQPSIGLLIAHRHYTDEVSRECYGSRPHSSEILVVIISTLAFLSRKPSPTVKFPLLEVAHLTGLVFPGSGDCPSHVATKCRRKEVKRKTTR